MPKIPHAPLRKQGANGGIDSESLEERAVAADITGSIFT